MAPLKGKFRVVSSAGEPLQSSDSLVRTGFRCPIFDHYGQTEVGMVVCNHHALSHPVHAGSAGLPSPGYRIAVLDEQGNEQPADTSGILAVDISQSPMMWFSGYVESRKSPS